MEADDEYRPIARVARVVWALAALPGIVLLLVLAGLLAFVEVVFGVIAIAVVVAIGVAWWVVTGRRWRAWGYAERERDLIVKKGVLVKRLTIVPYGRMQFVEVTQGPLERAFGLSTVALHTAAAATDAEIPYLSSDEAHRLRRRLTELGEANAAGV